ncbi:MAG: DUF1648 domain-containing protein [Aigarchaeota archaeon]|nr:DUF1648 domain-containing protein [Aigarchaeota archaeon]MCX8203757.1 DUF1648 domain-containing protein [Nitrososphaeria archaeon]MDW8043211.1 DUF1648 domain-containing protein [Nitrososphaerota archaeon]
MNAPTLIKVLSAVSLASTALLAVYALAVYGSLPELVAIDFDAAGRPTRYAPKSELLTVLYLLIGVLASVTALISVISLKRHVIVERYPYLVNLPALAILLGRLPEHLRRPYVDRVFLPLPAVGVVLNAAVFFPLVHMVLEAARTEYFPPFPVVAVVLAVSLSVAPAMIFYYRRIYRELKTVVT